ncbi:hypothetical protein PR003_g4510 [Phytophthora rubi]|uniref:THH1/TOM1/TOM3 domain-containing protein n=1 Tax=Phytophthora rubi TaxID=129364 RepID=A0A6A4FSQ4_9STRA|nr:hypothetical protein PR001_g15843 [Phytophthora rubi]KAE9039754.1 hypothetical protein PR002_g5318 [Phytophthora rubi]KAE9352170.1 hypothetical protein PR003_g4510 [Phytophthora rubi]
MVWLDPTSTLRCTSATLLPLMLLEVALVGVILWRTFHQLYWNSHPRRIFLHIVLLLSCVLRLVFWLGLCNSGVLAVGLACLWWSNSMVLLCTAAVIFQWSSAVTAGRVTAQELQRSKRVTAMHPLVFLHSIQLIWTTVVGVHVIAHGLDSPSKIDDYPEDAEALLLSYRIINISTLAFDAVVACYVAVQLRERLLSAAMADDMKKKSVVQMTLLMALLTASVTLQIIMDVPVFVSGLKDSWSSLSLEGFCVVKYFVPGLLLSLAFLYIMRRVEQREPARMVVVPSRSLVEFVECSSPDCVWCAHHRRYHLNQSKWDVTLMTSFSPRTVDSSFHSSTQANLSQGSWSSGSTPELHHHMSRDSHHRLHQGHQIHQPQHGRGHVSFPTHGDYEASREIPERRGARYS